jgi:hypothetical protein
MSTSKRKQRIRVISRLKNQNQFAKVDRKTSTQDHLEKQVAALTTN